MSNGQTIFIFILLAIFAASTGFLADQLAAKQKATTRLKFDTVAVGVCTVEGGGKTFMVIDVTKEMRTEEVEGPKEVE